MEAYSASLFLAGPTRYVSHSYTKTSLTQIILLLNTQNLQFSAEFVFLAFATLVPSHAVFTVKDLLCCLQYMNLY